MAQVNKPGLKGLEHIFSDFRNEVDNQTTEGVDFITDFHASGFVVNTDSTEFLGIEGSTYNNPGNLGFNGDVVNSIPDIHGFGFVPGLQAGDDTLFVGQLGPNYNNPGPNLGLFYVDDYQNGPTPDFISFTKNRKEKDVSEFGGLDEESDTYLNPIEDLQIQLESDFWNDEFGHKFTPNRQHLDISEFKGIDGDEYINPGINVGTYYYESYNDAGTGVDAIINTHATGFTKLRNHKDPSEFLMIDGDSINPVNDDINSGTFFRQFGASVFPFGNEEGKNMYHSTGTTVVEKADIDPDKTSLIQRGNVRSIGQTNMIQGEEVTAITLEDLYNDHINDLIDFDQVKSKVDGRLNMRHGEGPPGGGFLPLTFRRGDEPFVIRPIGNDDGIIQQHINDVERIGKYIITQDGIKFFAAQNIMGTLANRYNRSVKQGTSERYGFLGSAAGRQRFQYTYNPLSLFSTSVPFVKFRMSRAFLFDQDEYTTPTTPIKLFGYTFPDLTPNENLKVDGIDNQEKDGKGGFRGNVTTLGGDLFKNANTSIDGVPVNVQGITGDVHTTAPIATEQDLLVQSDIGAGAQKLQAAEKGFNSTDNTKLDSIQDGYPFYFKDLRNDKILMFRGYVKDISENVSPSYNTEQYIGRSEPVHSYVSTTRTLNFSLDLYANNKNEFEAIYQKLDYLTGMCYPQYYNDLTTPANLSLGGSYIQAIRPKPPLCRLRIADLYGSSGAIAQASSAKLKHGVFGYINAVSYTFNEEGTWNNFEEGGRAPKYITATIGYTIIHDGTPNINTRFYGLNHTKIGV